MRSRASAPQASIVVLVVLVLLAGCVPADKWSARVSEEGLEVAFCDGLDASSISASIRVPNSDGPDQIEQVWSANGTRSFAGGEPFLVGGAVGGMTTSGDFDLERYASEEVHVLVTGTEPGTNDSRGLEAILEPANLSTEQWTSNTTRRTDQPCT